MRTSAEILSMNRVKMAAKRADPFRKKAITEGYRSRAAYKLIQIDDKYNILAKCRGIVELGAYPGGWTQVILRRAPMALTVTCDKIAPGPEYMGELRQMTDKTRLVTICGDFRRTEVRREITGHIGSVPIDLVLSDMSPNISGNRLRDQAGIRELATDALTYATSVLTGERGAFLIKFFQGEEMNDFVAQVRAHFWDLKIIKPGASKKGSAEVYVLGNRFVGGNRDRVSE